MWTEALTLTTEVERMTSEHALMLEAKATAAEASASELKRQHAIALEELRAQLSAAQQGSNAFGAAEVLQERLAAAEEAREAANAQAARQWEQTQMVLAEKAAAVEELAALRAGQGAGGQGGAGQGATASEGGGAVDALKGVERSLSMMRKGLGATLSKRGGAKGESARGEGAEESAAGGSVAGAPSSAEIETQMEQLTSAFAAERAQLLKDKERMQRQLDELTQQPEQREWQGIQTQLQQVREEREAGREQLLHLSEQLTERINEVTMLQGPCCRDHAAGTMLQGSQAALRAE